MYGIDTSDIFDKKYLKLIKNDKPLEKKIQKTIQQLSQDPFYPSLKTHLVILSKWGKVYSSWVTGDIRIIWQQKNEELVLLLIDIGGHSGGAKVYK